MRKVLLTAAAAILLIPALPASAAEPVAEFVRGLRERGYFDTAEEYLDRVENDPEISADVKKVVPYQRALVISDNAMNQRNADLQFQLLDKAAQHLDEFIKNNPGHPRLGDAQSRRGKILLDKARVSTLESRSPANTARRDELRKKALAYIEEARKIYQGAHDSYRDIWKKFPKHIPPDKTKQLAARKQAEVDYIIAQIDLAKTTYEQAQVYKPVDEKEKSPRYNELLQKAAREFAEIHTTYRTQIAGLYAQMWQGKCYEEQNEIGRALGIFNALLDHPSKNNFYLNVIKPQALSFKLICLNHAERADYEIIEQVADEWLKKNRRLHGNIAGLRIRYELAQAREQLGSGAKISGGEKTIPPKQRPRYLRAALDDAKFVNRYQGRFKDVTTLMVARLQRKLGLATNDPKNFPDGFSAANVNYTRFNEAHDAWIKAKQAGKTGKELNDLFNKMKDELLETVRLYRLSLKLAKPTDDQAKVNQARRFLAFVLLKQQKSLDRPDLAYDAAVLAEFVARNTRQKDPDTARGAAYLALAAYIALYNKAPAARPNEDVPEMRWIEDIARYIVESWRGSKQAIDSAFILGNIYNQQERYLLAARWYASIPPKADRYADSLLNAGTNYWGHYSKAGSLDPSAENYRRELRAAAGENTAEAIATLLNPAHSEWQRLKRLEEVKQLLSASTGDGDANNAKSKQPAESPEIQKLKAQSKTDLLTALRQLSTAAMLEGKPETELRDLLFTELDRKNEAELRKMLDDRLAGMDEDALKAVFQQRLEEWQSLAAWHLAKGVQVRQKNLPDDAETPEDLVRAKVALAEYSNLRGDNKRAVDLLTAKPHDVMTAVQVDDPAKRPNDHSLKSREFASALYLILAQAYVGSRQLDKFKEAMNELKKLLGEGDASEITRIYKKLGRDLQKKIERLQNQNNEEQLKEERDNFQWVVNALYEDPDNLDYSTLVWIGETSYGLGEGLGNPAEAKSYFENAAKAYEQALAKNRSLPSEQRLAVQLRLINCLRRQQEFEKALAMVKDVLKDRPRLLPAQVEAAMTLQDWGRNKDSEKYLDAISGSKDDNIWGWRNIADELKQVTYANRQQMARAQNAAELQAAKASYDEMRQKYLEALYRAFFCRVKYGDAQDGDQQKKAVYNDARREILAFVSTVGVVKGDERFEIPTEKMSGGKKVLKTERVNVREAFDNLYAKVQRNLGTDPGDLQKLAWVEKKEPPKKINGGKEQDPDEDNVQLANSGDDSLTKKGDEKSKEKESGMLGMIFGILFLLAGLAGGGWFLFKSMGKDKGRSRRMAYAYGTETPVFGEAAPKTQRSSSGSSSKKLPGSSQQRRKAPSAGGGSGQKRTATPSSAKSQRPKRTPPKSSE